jgi:cytochrome c peroxidase
VANHLKNSVQIVDIEEGTIEGEISLGGPETPSLARKGMAIFYDGRRSLDQWYSCHSCHQETGSNSRPMDTMNDGTNMTFKTVLPLHNVTHTKPWTWHGWQEDLNSAMHKSMTSTMLGPEPSAEDVKALIAYLEDVKLPPNPFRENDGSLSAAAERGKQVFASSKAGCASCHSCHQEAGSNSRPMDTLNDGTNMTFKTVLPLHNITHTKPWTWHGWQEDLNSAMHKSMTSTMLGPEPSAEDVKALIAYLEDVKLPPNPFREKDGSLSPAAERGKQVFASSKAGCASCHSGPFFTDGKVHDVGLGSENDHYEGFNTPSLLGVYRRVRLLHHGRARSLEDLLTGLHAPSQVAGEGELTETELSDLVAYLKSL